MEIFLNLIRDILCVIYCVDKISKYTHFTLSFHLKKLIFYIKAGCNLITGNNPAPMSVK